MNLASVTSWENTDLSITFTPISSSSTIVVKGFINVYTGGNSGSNFVFSNSEISLGYLADV